MRSKDQIPFWCENVRIIRVEGVDRVKKGGRATPPPPPPPSPSRAEHTIMTEDAQESGHLQSMYSLVCGSYPTE